MSDGLNFGKKCSTLKKFVEKLIKNHDKINFSFNGFFKKN